MRNRSDKKYVLSTRSLSNATFSVLITWRSSSSKSAAVYKMSWKSEDFSQRYGDITIFKMAAVRHLGTVLPPYETTHEISVAGRSCLSNFMSIWYRSEFFAYLAWNSYLSPQNGGFRGLWTIKCDYSSPIPPKGTSLHKSASFKLSTVKIRRGVWPVGELTESVTDTQTGKFIFCPCIALDRQKVVYTHHWNYTYTYDVMITRWNIYYKLYCYKNCKI